MDMKVLANYSPKIKILSLILSFLIVFYLVPSSVYAEGLNNDASAPGNDVSEITENGTNNDGLESYYPTASHSAGAGGVGNINYYTGSLTFIIPTLTTTDSLFSFTPTLVYNSSLAGKDVTSEHVDIPFATSYMPKGFKLNIQETIVEREYLDENNIYQVYYVLYDADGTTHNFYQDSEDNNKFYDDSGLRLTLTFSGGNFYIEDTSKNIRTYSPINDTAWHLTSITDRYGNQLIFEFNTVYQPTKVIVKPNDLSEIEILSFLYESGKLIAVYNDYSKDSVILNCSNENLSKIRYCYGNSNTTEQNVREAYLSSSNVSNVTSYASAIYNFDSNGYLRYIKEQETYENLLYTVSNGKITAVTEFAGNTIGRKVSYYYGDNYTEVCSAGNDGTINTSDDIITRYVFDDYGRAISIYSMSVDGGEIYGITSGTYENDYRIKNNMKESTVLNGVNPKDVIKNSTGGVYFATINRENTTGIYKQTVFIENDVASLTESNSNMGYIISGFGYSNSIQQNEYSDFSLGVNVYYYQGVNTEDVVVSYSFDFSDIENRWQYICGKFSCNIGDSSTYKFVHKIEIVCSYYGNDVANQSAYAYFKDIAFTSIKNNAGYNYYFDEFGNLVRKENSLFWENYEYDSQNRLTSLVNSYNECYEYEYIEESERTVYGEKYYIFDTNSETYILVSESTSTYNKYGLLTKISIVDVANGSSGNYAASCITTEYTYVTDSDSKIFGALQTETDSLGNVTLYDIDENNGRLLHIVNPSSGTGYKYDYYDDGQLSSIKPITVSGGTYVEGNEFAYYSYYSMDMLHYIRTSSTEYCILREGFGNVSGIKIGDRTLATYEYYPNNGKLKKVNYGNGFSEEYVYNTLEMLKEVWYTYDDGTSEQAFTYTYNHDGTLDVVTNLLEGKNTKYSYDDEGKFEGIYEKRTDEEHYGAICFIDYDIDDKVSAITPIVTYNSTTSSGSKLLPTVYNYGSKGELSSETHEYLGNDCIINYGYDNLNRLSTVNRDFGSFDYSNTYTYVSNGNNTSYLVSSFTSSIGSSSKTYNYSYDSVGNITGITISNNLTYNYDYDNLGQLIQEENVSRKTTINYTYNNAGNITSIKTTKVNPRDDIIPYALTPPVTTTIDTVNLSYTDSSWGDLLTSYDGRTLTYDEIGNPLSYYNGSSYSFTWDGRKLVGAVNGSTNMSFTYNDDGIRTSKTVNGVTHTYQLNGNQIISEQWDDKLVVYIYDASGAPLGMMYRKTSYDIEDWNTFWFEKNMQGDIIALYNSSGTRVAYYTYEDAWGNHVVGYTNLHLNEGAQYNPFRYRGYYYDTDLGMYYLQSRYYDSKICRFISPDTTSVLTATPMALTDKNLYAYCDNNPVMRVDYTGEWWIFANAIVGLVVGAVTKILCNVIAMEEEWNDGVVGAAIGGAAYGIVLATTGNIPLASYAGAAMESIGNETVSYIPFLSAANNSDCIELTEKNAAASLLTVAKDTLINGTLNAITGTVASTLIPTNSGWFTPRKFVSSFTGKYAQKAHMQTIIQGIATFGIYCFHRKGMDSIISR